MTIEKNAYRKMSKLGKNSTKTRSRRWVAVCFVLGLLTSASALHAQVNVKKNTGGVSITTGAGVLRVNLLQNNIAWIDVRPDGRSSPRTLLMDPKLSATPDENAMTSEDTGKIVMRTDAIRVTVGSVAPYSVTVFDASGRELISERDPFGEAASRSVVFLHSGDENLYGMRGLSRRDNGGSLLRNNGAEVEAGSQGDAGGPWFFTTRCGVLIDSDGGVFDARDGRIQFSGNSRCELEYFVIAGNPLKIMEGLATLTGRPSLPPKATVGFLNSQWGIDETEARNIVATYRAKHIPLDELIFDFDWKAWGEDNYGEWRWNSTSTPESFSPNKFPDGASGAFAKEMAAEGVEFAGILKPRVLLYKKDSHRLQEAAAYAQEHNLWYPGEPEIIDYVTHRPARDLDFSKAVTRQWYWEHLEPAFHAGITWWWSDEADVTDTQAGVFHFDNFQFMNMGRALYEGQRSISDLRAWSLNRNYYTGAQRYGYAEWSGDIQTGFQSMAQQRARMLATLNLGEPWWGMDAGGFFGHPTPENYARWVEFSTFVPIDRVHGDLGEKRQPWVYGLVAEAAATRAIRLRYSLLPYVYSYARAAEKTGIGIVRPLFWIYPDDPAVANDSVSWMFGDALLVSPVVKLGESEHVMYLPAGTWFDYFRGARYEGGQTIHYTVDPSTWQDIPLFVRAGSILATRDVQDYVNESPAREVTLEVFAAPQPCEFIYYDDDGKTYAYERGENYEQKIRAWASGHETDVRIDQADGTYRQALQSYVIRVHGVAAAAVTLNGSPLHNSSGSAMADGEWSIGHDRFGVLTTVRLRADQESQLVLQNVNQK